MKTFIHTSHHSFVRICSPYNNQQLALDICVDCEPVDLGVGASRALPAKQEEGGVQDGHAVSH